MLWARPRARGGALRVNERKTFPTFVEKFFSKPPLSAAAQSCAIAPAGASRERSPIRIGSAAPYIMGSRNAVSESCGFANQEAGPSLGSADAAKRIRRIRQLALGRLGLA